MRRAPSPNQGEGWGEGALLRDDTNLLTRPQMTLAAFAVDLSPTGRGGAEL
jgi:hypothetical protein